MQNVIGIGSAGCNIAKSFLKYPEYTVRTIDCVEPSGGEHFRIKKCDSHEEYEQAVPDMTSFFSHIKSRDETLFIIGGSGEISGAALAILQQIDSRYFPLERARQTQRKDCLQRFARIHEIGQI